MTPPRILRLSTDVGDLILTPEKALVLKHQLDKFLGPQPPTQAQIQAGRIATWLGIPRRWREDEVDGIVTRVWKAMQEAQ